MLKIIKQKLVGLTSKMRRITTAVDSLSLPKARYEEDGGGVAVSRFFTGEAALNEFFIPAELVGGVCPRVRGQEREIVWHAAAEACDSERIHIIWNATDDKIWYLAARAVEFSGKPFTWCPFACFLPGMQDALPQPVIYLYFSDEASSMMTITEDQLQIHRGTSQVIRARAERMVRELGGEVPIIEIDPIRIMGLTPVAWYSLSLLEDRFRRALVLASVGIGGILSFIAFIVWLFASLSIATSHSGFEKTMERTKVSTMSMMQSMQNLRASAMREQIATFSDLNDKLVEIGGWLQFYKIENGKVRWRATVPRNVTGDRIKQLGANMLQGGDAGDIVIGTDDLPVNPNGRR